MKHPCIDALSSALGITFNLERLDALADWLVREAAAAGGVGPHEAARVWDRHICDSLAYAIAAGQQPERALDVGTGVGLPGLPLAILWPETEWTLVDRAGRRVDLVRRAARILDLRQVTVIQAEPETLADAWPLVVSRATFPPADAVRRLAPLVAPGGRGVVGIRRGAQRPAIPPPPEGTCLDLEPKEVLDPPAWFLIIRPCE